MNNVKYDITDYIRGNDDINSKYISLYLNDTEFNDFVNMKHLITSNLQDEMYG
jgi:hypothetical protein